MDRALSRDDASGKCVISPCSTLWSRLDGLMSEKRWVGLSEMSASQIEAALARGNKIEAIKLYSGG
jgi:hypothetical protein